MWPLRTKLNFFHTVKTTTSVSSSVQHFLVGSKQIIYQMKEHQKLGTTPEYLRKKL